MAILGINSTIQVAATYDTPAGPISAITAASPPVVTITSHGFSDGDIVVIGAVDGTASTVDVGGMSEINGQVGRVANQTANTFELESIDGTDFTAFSGSVGTATEILTWSTLGDAQSINAAQGSPNRIDITTLLDDSIQYQFGLPDSPEIQITNLLNPLSASTAAVRAASLANDHLPVAVTFQNGNLLYFNSYVSAGDGFEMSSGQPATSVFTFTQVRRFVWYAS